MRKWGLQWAAHVWRLQGSQELKNGTQILIISFPSATVEWLGIP